MFNLPGNKQRILIIEDDHDLRELYAEVLRDAGFEVDEAADGQIGLQHVAAEAYALILLDIMLPHTDGLEILRTVRSRDKSKDTKVVLLTNLDRGSIIKESFEFGADGYVVKSEIEPGELVEEVNSILSEAG